MNDDAGGYTIVEVLIVLAISALIFFAAMVVVGGQNGKTQFSQAMQDLASKIQNYGTQVSSGSFPDTSSYTCSVSGTKPVFTLGGTKDSQKCLILGRALLVTTSPPNSVISIYTVAGTRNQWASGADTGNQITTFEQANPEPAIDSSTGADLFLDSYNLVDNAKILSSSVIPASGGSAVSSNLIGLYANISASFAPNANGAAGLLAKAYPFTGLAAQVTGCIENSGPCAPSSQMNNFSQWNLCIASSSNSQRAQLNIFPTATGLKITTKDIDCS